MDLEGVDGYAVRRPLGAGSVGSAWLARDLASGRPVVLKRVPVTEVPVPELFRRDLALAQGLHHPHVARLLTIRQTDDDWLLVSEYVVAGTLSDLLQRRGPLSRGELVTLVTPLAQALAAAHEAGLTHGHLGCGDVMFTADGRPMLTDFGLRLTVGRETSPAADDLIALRDLALRAGAEPKVFSLKLFAGDGATLADRVLALAEPEPVNLGFDDPADSAGLPAASGQTPRAGGRTRGRGVLRRGEGKSGAPAPEPAHAAGGRRPRRGILRGLLSTRKAKRSRGAAPAFPIDSQARPGSDPATARRQAAVPSAKAVPSRGEPVAPDLSGRPLRLSTQTPNTAPGQGLHPTGAAKLADIPHLPTPVPGMRVLPDASARVGLPAELGGVDEAARGGSGARPARHQLGAQLGGVDEIVHGGSGFRSGRMEVAERAGASARVGLPGRMGGTGETARGGSGARSAEVDAATRRDVPARGERMGGRGEVGRGGGEQGSVGIWPELVSRVRLAHGLLVVAGLAAIVVVGAGVAMLRTAEEPGTTAYGAATPSPPMRQPSPGDPRGEATPGGSTGGVDRGSVEGRWLRMLRALDVRRSRAFASGDLRGLDGVYVPGSAPWRSDRSMLASYGDRGLRVVGLEIRIDRLVVARAAPGRVVLRVVDRLVAGTAIDRAGRRTALPPGRPVERLITLDGAGGNWRIVGVVAG